MFWTWDGIGIETSKRCLAASVFVNEGLSYATGKEAETLPRLTPKERRRTYQEDQIQTAVKGH